MPSFGFERNLQISDTNSTSIFAILLRYTRQISYIHVYSLEAGHGHFYYNCVYYFHTPISPLLGQRWSASNEKFEDVIMCVSPGLSHISGNCDAWDGAVMEWRLAGKNQGNLLQCHFVHQMNLSYSKVTRDFAGISRARSQRLTACTVRITGLF